MSKNTSKIKNFIKILGMANVRLVRDDGTRVRNDEIVEAIVYDDIIEDMKGMLTDLWEVIHTGSYTYRAPKLEAYVKGYVKASDFVSAMMSPFIEGGTVKGQTITVFNALFDAIQKKKITERRFTSERTQASTSFEEWLKSERLDSTSMQDRVPLHYIWEQTTQRKKAKNLRIGLSYGKDYIINNSPRDLTGITHGWVLVYPSTGKRVAHYYKGYRTEVAEYDPKWESTPRKWYYLSKRKGSATVEWERHATGYVLENVDDRYYGVCTFLNRIRLPRNQRVERAQMIGAPLVAKVTETQPVTRPSWDLAYPQPIEVGVGSLFGFSETADGKPGFPFNPTSSLDWFTRRPDWRITLIEEVYKFSQTVSGYYRMEWIDKTNPHNVFIPPGCGWDDGLITGDIQDNPADADSWLDIIDKAEDSTDIQAGAEEHKIPGVTVDPTTGEVIGKPGETIDGAVQEMDDLHKPVNPKILGLNVFSAPLDVIGEFSKDLWSSNFFEVVKKKITDPLSLVVSIHSIPIAPKMGASAFISAGDYTSKVSAPVVTEEMTRDTIGSFYVEPRYKGTDFAFLDYTHTSINLYVPYIGVIELLPSMVMGKTIDVVMTVDVLTGLGSASVYADGVLVSVSEGDCSLHYPLTAIQYGGGITSPKGLAIESLNALWIDASNNPIMGKAGVVQGSLQGGPSGIVDNRAILTIGRPLVVTNSDGSLIDTYDSMMRGKLGTFGGLVKVSKFSGSLGSATEEEIEEIKSLLQEGVIV